MLPTLTRARADAAVTAAALAFEVDPYLIRNSRQPRPSEARMAVYAALLAETDGGLSAVARIMQRDHSTVVHGVQRATALALDSDYANALTQIRRAVRGEAAQPAYVALLRVSQQLEPHIAILPASMLHAIAAELRRLLKLVEAAQRPLAIDDQTSRLYRDWSQL